MGARFELNYEIVNKNSIHLISNNVIIKNKSINFKTC